jgi:putative acetyltransferase
MTGQRLVREYVLGDLADIQSAWEGASALAHPFLTKQFLDQERINIPELYLPNAETWVVEESGRVIGFIALIGNEVGTIFVDPEFHGSGAGRALMDKARALRGDLEVEVFKENEIGRKFYARYGFDPLAETIHEPTGNALLRLKFSAG